MRGLRSGVPPETYVVCLECGKEFPYSWEEMKVLRGEEKEAVEVQETAALLPH